MTSTVDIKGVRSALYTIVVSSEYFDSGSSGVPATPKVSNVTAVSSEAAFTQYNAVHRPGVPSITSQVMVEMLLHATNQKYGECLDVEYSIPRVINGFKGKTPPWLWQPLPLIHLEEGDRSHTPLPSGASLSPLMSPVNTSTHLGYTGTVNGKNITDFCTFDVLCVSMEALEASLETSSSGSGSGSSSSSSGGSSRSSRSSNACGVIEVEVDYEEGVLISSLALLYRLLTDTHSLAVTLYNLPPSSRVPNVQVHIHYTLPFIHTIDAI